jgi:hypothetical protein
MRLQVHPKNPASAVTLVAACERFLACVLAIPDSACAACAHVSRPVKHGSITRQPKKFACIWIIAEQRPQQFRR